MNRTMDREWVWHEKQKLTRCACGNKRKLEIRNDKKRYWVRCPVCRRATYGYPWMWAARLAWNRGIVQ